MAIPKYQQVKNALLQKIVSGEFEPGDKFYSESELIELFQVSSITVIRALKELVSEGYLYSVQGKGRFVSRGKLGQPVRFTDVDKFPNEDADVTTHVISITEINDDTIRKKLKIDTNKKIYCFERLRKSNGIPFFLQYTYLSSDYVKEEDLKDPSNFISIYDKMRRDYNFHLTTSPSVEYYAIQFPTPKRTAQLLQISEDCPTSFAKRTTFLNDFQVVEYIESFKRWDYYETKIETI